MAKQHLDLFQELWSKPASEHERMRTAAESIAHFTQPQLKQALLWWTLYGRESDLDGETYIVILGLIVSRWSDKKFDELREHLRGERQAIDLLSTRQISRTKIDELCKMSTWIVATLLKPPLRT